MKRMKNFILIFLLLVDLGILGYILIQKTNNQFQVQEEDYYYSDELDINQTTITPQNNNQTSSTTTNTQVNTQVTTSSDHIPTVSTNTGNVPVVLGEDSCTSSTTPWIKLLSPNGGEVYQAGQEITVMWEGCNVTEPIGVGLVKHDITFPYDIETYSEAHSLYAGYLLGGFDGFTGTNNDGTQTVTLPTFSDQNLVPGQRYYFFIHGADDPNMGLGFHARDYTDSLFTIN